MRNLILYFFILTSFMSAKIEVIKPFPLVSEESLSDSELNLNLNNSVLGQYHTFKLAVFTEDKKYIIATTSNNTKNKYTKYNKIIVFDVQSKKIVYVYENKKDDEVFTYLKVIGIHLYTVNSQGYIKKWKINNKSKKGLLELLPSPFLNKNFGIVKEILNNNKNIFIHYLPNKKNLEESKVMISDINNSNMSFISKNDIAEYNIYDVPLF